MTHLLLAQCVIQSKMLYFHKELKEKLKFDYKYKKQQKKKNIKIDDGVTKKKP